jgi:hypothetical protein
VGLEFMYGDAYVAWLITTNIAVVAAAYALTHSGGSFSL